MNKQQIIDAINEYIKTNGVQEITGQVMNLILSSIANIIPDDSMLTSSFGGVITPASVINNVPGQATWFWAAPGTYTSANNLNFTKNGVLSYSGADWSKLEFDMDTILKDQPGGVLSFEVGKGQLPIPSGALVPTWVKKEPPLVTGYYTHNTNTNEVAEVIGNTFKKTFFTAKAGERIRVKIGQFYIQNNSNGINPICIYIKNSAGEVIYFSKAMNETSLAEPPVNGGVTTGTFEFERDILVDSTIYVCGDYGTTAILDTYVRENVPTGNHYILNTSKADVSGGYVSFDSYVPGGANVKLYKNKMLRVAGDSISEPGGVNAPTTSKYWYQYLAEDLEMNYKTYAFSGNQWTDVYNQLVQMKSDEASTGVKTDVLVIFAGTNDFFFDAPIGNFYNMSGSSRVINLNDSSFKGRLNKVLNYARRNFPTAQIVVCNILHRGTFQGSGGELVPNGIGVFLDEYSKAIDEATNIWSTPLIDLRGETNLYPVSEMSSFYTMGVNSDMLHPSYRGHFRIFGLFKARLLSLPLTLNLQ